MFSSKRSERTAQNIALCRSNNVSSYKTNKIVKRCTNKQKECHGYIKRGTDIRLKKVIIHINNFIIQFIYKFINNVWSYLLYLMILKR
jgi:hypothetical protein